MNPFRVIRMQDKKSFNLVTPETLLIGGFAGVILLGAVVLFLPCSHRLPLSFLNALFTSTSAVCVTGLTVVDTGTTFTRTGQIIILLLIQTGALGVMTFAAMAFRIFGMRLSLKAQAAVYDTLVQKDIATEFKGIFIQILSAVMIIELSGFLLLTISLLPSQNFGDVVFSSAFHSISAFGNAGFSIYPDNLTGLRDNDLFLFTIMSLIILGGIGHPVIVDVWVNRRIFVRNDVPRYKAINLNSKIVLWSSGILIFGGALLLLVLGLTGKEITWSDRITGALFQSVTARTAGFNTIDIGSLPIASLLILIILMFIGGSPGSCAGGIKTTTFTIWLAKLWRTLHGEKWPRLFGRHIPNELARRASMIIGLSVIWNLLGIILLSVSEISSGSFGLQDVVFEQISAFGTVGLSTGLTVRLSEFGRIWIILTMLVGRVGPISMVLWLFKRKNTGIWYPEGRVMIG